MYIQMEVKVYTSGSQGMYNWTLRYMQVEAKEYTSSGS